MPPGGQKMNYQKNRPHEVNQRAMPIGKMVLFVILPFRNQKRHRSRETWPHFDQALYSYLHTPIVFLDNLVSKLLNTSLKGKIGIFLTFVCVFDNFLLQTLQMDRNLNFVSCENMKEIGYFSKIAEVFRNWRPIICI